MEDRNKLIRATLAGLVAAGAATLPLSAAAGDKGKEKCYGVAKAGMNDCGTSQHGCSGHAKTDGDPEEWVYLPAGTCDKIVGGSKQKKPQKG